MRSWTANEDFRLPFWQRVREFAVPLPMIRAATARRAAGDWAGACAAARIDVDLELRAVARLHGRDLAARVRADLRRLAPDLLRWHMPRIAPDGLLRPGLTVPLARYGALCLVVRTPPAWADAGQRMSLALWDGAGGGGHPHPRPDRRFRLDLHRHLWDAERAGELRQRSGAEHPSTDLPGVALSGVASLGEASPGADLSGAALPGCAVDRWADEVALLRSADGPAGDAVTVRLDARRRLLLRPGGAGLRVAAVSTRDRAAAWRTLPVLPDAATWTLPDLELLRAGLIDAGRLHPLVAAALVPGRATAPGPWPPEPPDGTRIVDCRGARHRIGLVDGMLVPLDHDPAEIRREELLAALSGPLMPCLRAIDEAHRRPECLADVRGRLDHGDAAGALAAVEGLLGPDAVLRGGALRDELETAAARRVQHGLFRAGLAGRGPLPADWDRLTHQPAAGRRRATRTHPRNATAAR